MTMKRILAAHPGLIPSKWPSWPLYATANPERGRHAPTFVSARQSFDRFDLTHISSKAN
jgi:hypothetical protein